MISKPENENRQGNRRMKEEKKKKWKEEKQAVYKYETPNQANDDS